MDNDKLLRATNAAQVLAAYGGAEQALSRFTTLEVGDGPLNADERVEYDQIGAAFSDMRRLVDRFYAFAHVR